MTKKEFFSLYIFTKIIYYFEYILVDNVKLARPPSLIKLFLKFETLNFHAYFFPRILGVIINIERRVSCKLFRILAYIYAAVICCFLLWNIRFDGVAYVVLCYIYLHFNSKFECNVSPVKEKCA